MLAVAQPLSNASSTSSSCSAYASEYCRRFVAPGCCLVSTKPVTRRAEPHRAARLPATTVDTEQFDHSYFDEPAKVDNPQQEDQTLGA